MLIEWLKRFYKLIPGIREWVDIRTALQFTRHELSEPRTLQAFRLLDFDLHEHPRNGDSRRLLRYQFQVCSQNEEDGIIRDIFRRVGTTGRYFVGVGVGGGKENNTALLLSEGWKGTWIEDEEALLDTLERRRGLCNGRLKWLIPSISRENAAAIFERLGVAREFVLLSIDVDQNTSYIWEGLRGYRPRVVVIEYNPAIPPDVHWKVAYDPERTLVEIYNYGASLNAYDKLGRELGDSLVGCEFTGNNAFLVRDDLVGDRLAAPFTSENYHEPARYVLVLRRGHAAEILHRPGPVAAPKAGSRPAAAGRVEHDHAASSPVPHPEASGSQRSQDRATFAH